MARVWRWGPLWLLGCLAVMLYATPGGAQVRLMLDGQLVATSDALTRIGSGLGMSAAVMAEELGIEVDDSRWPVVQLRSGRRVASIEVGQRSAMLDGRALQLQAAPAVRDGMLYVPLHLVADLAGYRVEWDLAASVLIMEPRRSAPSAAGMDLAAGGPADAEPSVSESAVADPGAAEPAETGPVDSEPAGVAPAGIEPVLVQGLEVAPPGAGANTAGSGDALVAGVGTASEEIVWLPETASVTSEAPTPLAAGDNGPPVEPEPFHRPHGPSPSEPPASVPSAPGPDAASAGAQPSPPESETVQTATLQPVPERDWSLLSRRPIGGIQERGQALRSEPAGVAPTSPPESDTAVPVLAADSAGQPALPPLQAASSADAVGSALAEAPASPVQQAVASAAVPEAEAPRPLWHEAEPRSGVSDSTSGFALPDGFASTPNLSASGPLGLPSPPGSQSARLPRPEGTEAGTLLDVRLRTADGRPELVALTDGPVEARAMYLPNPDRLVIDLPGAGLATDWRAVTVDDAVLHQLRLSGEDGGVRLVADLTGPTGYTLMPAESHPGFVVRLNHQLRGVTATPLEDGAIALMAEVSGGPVAYQAFVLREPWRLVVDLLEVTVPAPFDLRVDSPLVQAVRVSQFQHNTVRVVLELGGPVEWPNGGVGGEAHPDPDGLITLVLDTDGSVAFAPRAAAEAANGLEFVGFLRNGDAELVLLQSSAPLDAEVRRLRDPERIVLDLPGVLLERSLGPLAPPESAVVTAVRAGQAAPGTGRVVVETRQVAEHQVMFSQDRTRAVLSVRPSQLAGRTVVVDPGHGGRDPGAIGPGGTQEKDVNLAIALEVARLLEQAGARVILTRDRDVSVELATRSRMANALRADVFVSIHADAIGPGRTASGTGTFYHPGPGEAPGNGTNALFGQAVHRELVRAAGLPDRGLRQRAFHVLIHTEMPAVLVEVAFIDNPAEERLLTDPEFQRRAALGIAQGVVRYFADQGNGGPVRTIAQWDAALQEVAAAFLENGHIPAGAVEVAPAAALGARSETAVAQTQDL